MAMEVDVDMRWRDEDYGHGDRIVDGDGGCGWRWRWDDRHELHLGSIGSLTGTRVPVEMVKERFEHGMLGPKGGCCRIFSEHCVYICVCVGATRCHYH